MSLNPHANFTPTLLGYSGQEPFRFWCQTALPLTYDDSLSYYELLNKVVTYLNNTIGDVSAMETNVGNLAEAYEQLQGYVNDYFDNLDIEAELRNVLDAMALDGTMDELLSPIVENQLPGVVENQISDVVAEQIDQTVAEQIDDVVEEQLPPLVSAGISDEVSEWLTENVDPVGSAVIVDSSLTISGAAADAKVTGDEIGDLNNALSNGLTVAITWEQGRFNATTGALANSDYAIRSKDFIPVLARQKGVFPLFTDIELPSGATNLSANIVEYSSISPLTKVKNTIINRGSETELIFDSTTTYYKITINYLTAGQHLITPDYGYLCNLVIIDTPIYNITKDIDKDKSIMSYRARPNMFKSELIVGRIRSDGTIQTDNGGVIIDKPINVISGKTYRISVKTRGINATTVTLYATFYGSDGTLISRSAVSHDKFIDVNENILGAFEPAPADGTLLVYILGGANPIIPDYFYDMEIVEDAVPTRLLLCGDSICAGIRNDNRGFGGGIGYPYKNIGIGNTTLANTYESLDYETTDPDNIPSAFLRDIGDYVPDVIIADGGFNDYARHSILGTIPDKPALDDTEAAALDRGTTTGGLGYLFYQMTKLYPLAKRIFVITHKVGKPNNQNVMRYFPIYPNTNADESLRFTQGDLYEALVKICKLYSVKIVDIYMESNLDSGLPGYVSPSAWESAPNVANQYCIDSDYIHPTVKGYNLYYYPMVKNAIKELIH